MIKTTEVSARSAHRAVQAVTDVPALLRCAAMVLAALLVGTLAHAGYPEKPVRIISPFPGGASDALTRVLADQLQQLLKQPFVVDSKSGAGGNIGMEATKNSPPDGYTAVSTTVGTIAIVSKPSCSMSGGN